MNGSGPEHPAVESAGGARPAWVEAAAVLAAGIALSLLANAFSPRGLSLTRDYFPSSAAAAPPVRDPSPAAAKPRPAALALDPVAARLQAKGLKAIDFPGVRALFEDQRRAQGLLVFVDARDDFIYQVGHIPGAQQFNHYRPEERLAEVVAACAQAEQVVVYCTGGDCEDSEFAAIMLTQAGIPADKLQIYVGGMDEWSAKRQPVEVGLRGSGVIKELAR